MDKFSKRISEAPAPHKFVSVDRFRAHIRTPLYHNAYMLMVSTFATSGLGLLYWLLAPSRYPAEAVGLNAAIISMMQFLAGVVQLPLMSAIIRFVPTAGRSTRRFILATYVICAVAVATLTVSFIAGVAWWSPSLSILRTTPLLGVWFVVGTVGWSLFALQDNVLTSLRQTVYIPIENTGYAIAKLILLLVFATSFASYGIFASWTIPVLLVLVPITFLLFWRIIPDHVKTIDLPSTILKRTNIIRYTTNNFFASLFVTAYTRLLPVIVLEQAGLLASGYFFLPWTVMFSLRLITANMTTSLTVEGAMDDTRLATYSRKFLIHCLRLLIPLTTIVILSAPYLLQLAGQNYAREGTLLLRLLALSIIPNIVSALYVSIARVRQRTLNIIIVQASFCALVLLLSYTLLRMFGIVGVGIGVLVSETVIAAWLLLTQLRPILKSVVHQGTAH